MSEKRLLFRCSRQRDEWIHFHCTLFFFLDHGLHFSWSGLGFYVDLCFGNISRIPVWGRIWSSWRVPAGCVCYGNHWQYIGGIFRHRICRKSDSHAFHKVYVLYVLKKDLRGYIYIEKRYQTKTFRPLTMQLISIVDGFTLFGEKSSKQPLLSCLHKLFEWILNCKLFLG